MLLKDDGMTSSIPQPAGYGPTDAAEKDAVNVFCSSLDTKLIKDEIKVRDTHPNIDGFLELVDSSGFPRGKLEVQVRKIGDGQLKYQCPRELFVYSGCTTLPVILVCVDTGNKKVFWKHIKEEDFPFDTEQASVNISFDSEHAQVTTDKKYYARWLTIIEDYSQRIQNYKLLRSLSANVTALPPTKSEEVGKIQDFLDELNGLLDGDYSCVKRIKFPKVWKIGFGLSDWTKDSISYYLFAVEKGENKPLISSPSQGMDVFSFPDSSVYGHYGPNDLLVNPKLAAKRYIYDSFKEILNHQLLSIKNPYLCREYIISYIYTHAYCLGLDIKDDYGIKELKEAFYDYLPRWCDIALKSLTFYPPHLGHADPGIIHMMLGKDIKNDVKNAVNNKTPIQQLIIGSSRFSYRLLFDLIEYCEISGLLKVERLYKSSIRPSGPMIWDGYKEEDAFYNFKLVYDNFEAVYSEFLKLNGLNAPALSLFTGQEFQVCKYSHPTRPLRDYPGQNIYRLSSDSGQYSGPRVIVLPLKDNSFTYTKPLNNKREVQLGNEKYTLKSSSMGIADFLFQANPMLNLVYRTLSDRLESAIKATGKS